MASLHPDATANERREVAPVETGHLEKCDPPWRVHEDNNAYIGRKVRVTTEHRVSSRRTIQLEQIGIVVAVRVSGPDNTYRVRLQEPEPGARKASTMYLPITQKDMDESQVELCLLPDPPVTIVRTPDAAVQTRAAKTRNLVGDTTTKDEKPPDSRLPNEGDVDPCNSQDDLTSAANTTASRDILDAGPCNSGGKLETGEHSAGMPATTLNNDCEVVVSSSERTDRDQEVGTKHALSNAKVEEQPEKKPRVE